MANTTKLKPRRVNSFNEPSEGKNLWYKNDDQFNRQDWWWWYQSFFKTQDEYNALPASKESDWNLYIIVDHHNDIGLFIEPLSWFSGVQWWLVVNSEDETPSWSNVIAVKLHTSPEDLINFYEIYWTFDQIWDFHVVSYEWAWIWTFALKPCEAPWWIITLRATSQTDPTLTATLQFGLVCNSNV